MARKLEIQFIGDDRDLQKAFGRAEKSAGGFGGKIGKVGKVAAGALAGGVVAGGAALLSFGKAAAEAEKSQSAMETQLKALGISYKSHASQIDTAIGKTAKLAAVDDEDLQGAFTNIVRVTGDVTESLKLTGLAADLARAKNIDLAKAGEIVGKVAGGNTGVLGRYGIQIDKGATATEALGVLQKKFAGQAEAYGKTSAGAQDRFRNAVENLQEKLGKGLLPVFAKVTGAVAKFVEGMESGTGAGGKFLSIMKGVFSAISGAVSKSIGAIRGYLDKHREDLDSAGEAAANVGKAFKFVFEKVMLPIVEKVIPIIQTVIEGGFKHIANLVKILSGILTGDFGKAWDGVKDTFTNTAATIVGIVKGMTGLFATAIGGAMGALADGIKTAGGNLYQAAATRVAAVVSGVRSIVDDMLQAGKSFILHIGTGIAEAGTNLYDAARSRVAGVVSGVRSIIDEVLQAGRAIIAAVGSGIAGAATNLFDAAVDRAKSILSGFRSIIDEAKNIGGAIIRAVASGLAGAAGFARAAANKVIDTINAAIPNSLNLPSPLPNVNLPDNPIPRLATGGTMNRSGWALVGEQGPELTRLPAGARVYPARQTAQMMGGAGTPDVHVYIGDQELKGMIRVELRDRDRGVRGAYLAGGRA